MLIFLFVITTGSVAQESTSSEKIANELSNPVASMISVPISNNLDVGVGPYHGSKFISNIQPVVPVYSTSKVNIVTRTIIPIIDQKDITCEGSEEFGLGDINFSAFISPISPANTKVIWGVGPSVSAPTSTKKVLGAGKWSLGPTAVVLRQANGLTYGTLVRQTWSIGGDNDRSDVNLLYIQPFFAYNFKSGTGLTLSSDLFQDFKSDTFTGYVNVMGSMVYSSQSSIRKMT